MGKLLHVDASISRIRFSFLLLLLLGAAHQYPLSAQAPPQRLALRAFQDSVRSESDSATLVEVEQRLMSQVKQRRNDPLLHIRLGLVGLRLRELGSKKHLDYAISEFEWAVDLKPDWPWSWYGLALAEQAAPDRAAGMAGGLFTLLHLDRDTRSGTAFSKALKIDSTFAEALLGMSNVALGQRNGAPITNTLNAVRRQANIEKSAELFIALGRLERLGGNPDSALVAFSRARDAGGPSSLVWLEIARTIPLTMVGTPHMVRVPEGDTAYYIGAASNDPEVVKMYRADLEPIVQDSALKGFDAATGRDRAQWLRDFWDVRDAVDMLPAGSRLEEHFRRWNYALRNYRLPRERRMYGAGMETYKSGNTEVDDRGIVYLRHGAPDRLIVYGPGGRPGSIPSAQCSPAGQTQAPRNEVIQARANDIPIKQIGPPLLLAVRPVNTQNYGNETWIYERPDAEMMLHFAANSNPADYRLQATVFGLAAGGGGLDYGNPNPGLRRFCRMPGSRDVFDWAAVGEEKIRAKGANMMATTTDSWTRNYDGLLDGKSEWFAVGARENHPLVHLLYSFSTNALPVPQASRAPVTFRAVFLDAQGKIVATIDTVENVTKPLGAPQFMTLRLEKEIPATAQRVRLNVELTPDIGAVHRTDTLRLPKVDGAVLSLSDILIGRSPRSLRWRATPTETAWLDQTRVTYASTDTLQVYAEAYGVETSSPYTVKLTFTRKASGLSKIIGGRSPTISLSEPATYAETTARFHRAVTLSALQPGVYQMDLTFEGKNGKVTKSRTITIKQ